MPEQPTSAQTEGEGEQEAAALKRVVLMVRLETGKEGKGRRHGLGRVCGQEEGSGRRWLG